ncbi:uncharacterized protein LOC129618281 [Condylostylus longicornis]|uniref:uncharacterized protein LOC129618281 n=1 Tax=Condylostylus longicornis TaxID=2530218 RepID=UPI00244DD061|nr:uncharacterized protein LOC129618281 [Condylostylus longicornis]
MCGERRTCLSPLEQERCRIIPALPQLFESQPQEIESLHRNSVDAWLRDSTTDSIHSHEAHQANHSPASRCCGRDSSINITNVFQLAEVLPPQDTKSTLPDTAPFRFVPVQNSISATNINSQRLLSQSPSTASVVSSHSSHSLQDLDQNENLPENDSKEIPVEERETQASPEAPLSKLASARKDSCSCYGVSRDSAPLLQDPASTTVLSSEFPHLATTSRHVIDIVQNISGLTNQKQPEKRIQLRYLSSASPQHPSAASNLPPAQLFGFPDGPIGLLKGEVVLLGDGGADLPLYLNRGGCEALSYRPLRSLAVHTAQLEQAVNVLKSISIDGLVIYAGREDLLAASKLAETAARLKCNTRIIAVPHSVGGDIFLPEYLPTTLGFDTARRISTELIGNIATDSVSSKKYYHFLRGGSSILTLEGALVTRPTVSIIAEEAHQMNLSLQAIVEKMANIISFRAETLGKRSGTILMSENLVESLPELQVLMEELTERLSCSPCFGPNLIDPLDPQPPHGLTHESERLFRLLPKEIRLSLLTRQDHEGRPALPPIHSEILVAHLVDRLLRKRPTFNASTEKAFLYRTHDMNHECHCAMPTDFDCCLGYGLAHVAGALIAGGHNGYVACE